MNKKLSLPGRLLIMKFEGSSDRVYSDVAGYPTIGIGHLIKDGNDEVLKEVLGTDDLSELKQIIITTEQMLEILERDVVPFESAVNKLVRVPITQKQFDALVSFTFNLGQGALKSSTLLRELNQKKPSSMIAEQFIRWVNAGGKKYDGLVIRRLVEAGVFLDQYDIKQFPMKAQQEFNKLELRYQVQATHILRSTLESYKVGEV